MNMIALVFITQTQHLEVSYKTSYLCNTNWNNWSAQSKDKVTIMTANKLAITLDEH